MISRPLQNRYRKCLLMIYGLLKADRPASIHFIDFRLERTTELISKSANETKEIYVILKHFSKLSRIILKLSISLMIAWPNDFI